MMVAEAAAGGEGMDAGVGDVVDGGEHEVDETDADDVKN